MAIIVFTTFMLTRQFDFYKLGSQTFEVGRTECLL